MPAQLPPAEGRPRGRPTSEDTAKLETALLDAALAEFVNQGYGGASLSRIIRRANVSKTTLYARFPSKEALFRAVMARQYDGEEAADALRPIDGALDVEAGLKSFANRMLARSFESGMLAVNRLILSEAHRFPEIGVASNERLRLGVDRVAAFLRESSGESPSPVEQPEQAAETFIHLMRGWYMHAVLTNRVVTVAEREAWVEFSVQTLLHGVER